MSESISVTDHINNVNTLFSKLAVVDYNINKNECAKLLLQNLRDSYDQYITNLTNNGLTYGPLSYTRNLGAKAMEIYRSLHINRGIIDDESKINGTQL